MNFQRFTRLLILAALLGLFFGNARAAAETCDMWTSNLGFMMPYDAFAKKPNFSIATINYNCKAFKKPALFIIDISGGNSNDPRSRYMSNGSERLYYNLYADDALTQIWGDGMTGVHYTQSKKPDSNDRIMGSTAVMASIKTLQNPRVGRYSDNLTVTLTIEH